MSDSLPSMETQKYEKQNIKTDSQKQILIEREHFLRHIQQMKNNAVLIRKHADGRLEPVFVSEEFAKMMECSVPEAIRMIDGMGFYKSTNPEDRPLVRSMLKRRVTYDGGSVLTIQKITAKRNRIWCNVHYSFIDDFGEQYIYCTYTDVTALKRHEERLRSVYSSMGNNFYQLNDKTLAILRVNLTRDRFEEIKGKDLYDTDSIAYSYTESMRERVTHYPVSSEQAQFLKTFDKDRLSSGYLEGRTSVSMVLFSVRRDGRSCFVNFQADITRHPLSGDTVAFITEKECNSEKVRETLMNKILAQQFDMVAYLVDGQYGVTIGESARIRQGNIFPTSNQGDYSAYLKNQVMPVLYGSEEQKDAMAEALSLPVVEEQLKVQEPYEVNIAIEMEGEIYDKQFDFFNIDPEAKFYILMKRDTTEIQKEQMALNNQLRDALEAANQANVAKTAFLSRMSHEIRTPMNAIIGLDSLALNEADIPEKVREYLEKIGSSARHLLGLINDILDMSRIESGRMVLKHEEFSFGEMLEQIGTMINSQCQDRGLWYECRIIGHVDEYYIGDAMKLKQVLINILGNAVKFTPAPGTIRFIVERIAEFDGQSTLRFIIEDTGIGMDASYLPRIFDAFSQENDSNTNRYGSSGLGLAITKNIVEMMNGNISVESEKGSGSTFTVNVTLRNSSRNIYSAGDGTMQKLNVLVIDEDPAAREHTAAVLQELGVSSDICPDGKEAVSMIKLKQARREAYHLILLDRKLVGQSGAELARKIRGQVGEEEAEIILTGYGWDDIKEEAMQAGVNSFIPKPVFASHLLSVLHLVLDKDQSSREKKKKADLTGRRILLAEDMIINAEIVKEILKMMDMKVEHAENGQVTVDMFTRNPEYYYDAVLMDMRMPVMDGLTAAKEIRASGKTDSLTIPIIALTANAFDEDVQRSLQAGMNAHLSKPVEPQQLFDTLGELIED